MSKITNKERLEIWEKWKEGKGSIELSKEYGINDSSIRYLVRLLEAHGPGVLNQEKYRKYSKELKEEAIKKEYTAFFCLDYPVVSAFRAIVYYS